LINSTGSSNPLVNDTTNQEIIIKDFIDSIKTGKDPLITGKSARNATEIILDIYKNQF
jgi:UDP-N-acetyl-2-amino-2-deoxyglucuronate dehydrogenase